MGVRKCGLFPLSTRKPLATILWLAPRPDAEVGVQIDMWLAKPTIVDDECGLSFSVWSSHRRAADGPAKRIARLNLVLQRRSAQRVHAASPIGRSGVASREGHREFGCTTSLSHKLKWPRCRLVGGEMQPLSLEDGQHRAVIRPMEGTDLSPPPTPQGLASHAATFDYGSGVSCNRRNGQGHVPGHDGTCHAQQALRS